MVKFTAVSRAWWFLFQAQNCSLYLCFFFSLFSFYGVTFFLNHSLLSFTQHIALLHDMLYCTIVYSRKLTSISVIISLWRCFFFFLNMSSISFRTVCFTFLKTTEERMILLTTNVKRSELSSVYGLLTITYIRILKCSLPSTST